MEKPIKVYRVERHEYTKDFKYTGEKDETGEYICEVTVKYTGKISRFIYTNKPTHSDLNAVPEWKQKVISEHQAVKGHKNTGLHVYDISRNPLTIID